MICPYCRESLASPAAGAITCVGCRTTVHGECALLHGGCVTYGCRSQVLQAATSAGSRSSRRLRPTLPARGRLRRRAHDALTSALDPANDLILIAFGAAGTVGLALLACVELG